MKRFARQGKSGRGCVPGLANVTGRKERWAGQSMSPTSDLRGGGTLAQRRSGHVTLLDIARACGFSVSTVSIVLSEAPLSQNVAEKTRQQIRAKAQQLG